MNDSRYPYTYCADFIRKHAGLYSPNESSVIFCPKLSRSDASKLKHKISEALGTSDHELACKLADAYLREQGE